MIWALGTGRCGTASIAKQLGGVHEPGNLNHVLEYALEGAEADPHSRGSMDKSFRMGQMSDEILRRRDMDVPVVSDPRHSYIISWIRAYDKKAQFLWLYRDAIPVIRSWLARGNWAEDDPLEGRYHPRGGYPDSWNRLDKACWFYRSINGLIRRDLLENFQVLRCPEDLTEWENANTKTTWQSEHAVKLTQDDCLKIEEECGPMMMEMDLLRGRTRGAVL